MGGVSNSKASPPGTPRTLTHCWHPQWCAGWWRQGTKVNLISSESVTGPRFPGARFCATPGVSFALCVLKDRTSGGGQVWRERGQETTEEPHALSAPIACGSLLCWQGNPTATAR